MVCPACLVERADYEGPGGRWLPACPNCNSEEDPRPYTGLDRLRRAIRQDRGEFAPRGPLTLCGEPDGSEVWADGRVDP